MPSRLANHNVFSSSSSSLTPHQNQSASARWKVAVGGGFSGPLSSYDTRLTDVLPYLAEGEKADPKLLSACTCLRQHTWTA